MVFDTNISLAVKSNSGQYQIHYISLFQIKALKKIGYIEKIAVKKDKEIEIYLKCPFCENVHRYVFDLFDEDNNMLIGGCPSYGSPVILCGKEEYVYRYVSGQENVNKDIHHALI